MSSAAASAHAASAAAPAASALPDMKTIKARVDAIAAQGASHASASKKPKKTISKEEAAEERFRRIRKGTLKHSDKSAFKGSVISDYHAARVRNY
jgi:hypothetical protein